VSVSRNRFGATITAAAWAIAAVVVLGPAARPALANGIGDLYVAAKGGVDEVHVLSQKIVNTVDLTPAPTALAFSPDGRSLYSADGGRFVTRIDIETISVAKRIAVPAAVGALADSRDDLVAIAYPARRTVGVLDPSDDMLTETAALPGAVDLLAADRHEARIVAAEHGASWLAVVDPATRSIKTLTVSGKVVGIAVDPACGFAFAATMGTNQVLKIDLAKGSVTWKAPLTDAPVTLSAGRDGGAFVAAGKQILEVADGAASPWATAAGEVETLARSDDGGALYAASGDEVQAFTGSGALSKTIQLGADAAPAALAPVPRASSIAGDGAGAGTGDGPGASGKPHAPSTDTIAELAERIVGLPWLAGALGTAAMILVLAVAGGRWYARRVER
jgi:DNA-binding beta-propeller fold protein YncE